MVHCSMQDRMSVYRCNQKERTQKSTPSLSKNPTQSTKANEGIEPISMYIFTHENKFLWKEFFKA